MYNNPGRTRRPPPATTPDGSRAWPQPAGTLRTSTHANNGNRRILEILTIKPTPSRDSISRIMKREIQPIPNNHGLPTTCDAEVATIDDKQ